MTRTSVLGAGLLLVAGLGMGGCAAPQPTARQEAENAWNAQRAALKFEQAGNELRQGRPDMALDLAKDAVALSPDSPENVRLLAQAYVAKGDFNSAQRLAEQLLARNPRYAEAAYLLGTIHEQQQRWDAAIDAFGRAYEAGPEQVDYLIALAQVVAQRTGPAEAIALLNDAATKFDAEPAYFLALAELQREKHDLAAASAAYGRAIGLGIDDPAAKISHGLCLFWLGHYAQALPLLEPAARAPAQAQPVAKKAYAAALLALDRPREAREWLERFSAEAPRDGALWLLLARAQAETHDLSAAVASARRAVALQPDSADARAILAAVLIAAGDIPSAKREVDAALELDPQDAELKLLRGRISERLGEREKAESAYRDVLRQDSGNLLAADLLRGMRTTTN